MIDQIIFAILIGCFAGTLTGLFPGLHINLVSIGILSVSAFLLEITSPLVISIFILAMAITHTFLDAIPSIFLGAPESETALSVLPGHSFLLKGKGHEAVMLTLSGSVFSLGLAILISPIIILLVKNTYFYLEKIIVYILILSVIFLILNDKKSKSWALIIFLLTGVLGISLLNSSFVKEPLFPLFSGLFGTSTLIVSILKKNSIPKQIINKIKINKLKLKKALRSSLFAGGLCSFLPGLGPAQAAVIGSQFSKNLEKDGFLILIGGLNTINMVFSLIALYVINKSRNGAILVVSKLMNEFTKEHLILFLIISLIVGVIATYLTIFFSKTFAKNISKIDYNKTCIFILILIFSLVSLISGFFGLLVLITSTFIGILTITLNVNRSHMMGSLLLPVIIYFL
tara:strand:+ start:813 stop:2012 length:1200 start_codon:yes stop_codon:yes gene_type:complete